MKRIQITLAGIWWLGWAGISAAQTQPPPAEPQMVVTRPIDGIRDNSFLVEEAYNQERGVVQHIVGARLGVDARGADREREWEVFFAQEWPLFSQKHQVSYTVPYVFLDTYEDGVPVDKIQGVGDVTLSYRYQLLNDEEGSVAFAPRFTLILSTGDEERGLGYGVQAYEWNLPFSKTITDRAYFNLNLGFAYIPDTRAFFADGGFSPEYDLYQFRVGGSLMYAVTDSFHFVLETLWSGNHELQEMEDMTGTPLAVAHRFYQHDVTVLPGFRMAFNLPRDLQIVPGIGIPIGLTENAPDLGVFFYLSIEHPFLAKKG